MLSPPASCRSPRAKARGVSHPRPRSPLQPRFGPNAPSRRFETPSQRPERALTPPRRVPRSRRVRRRPGLSEDRGPRARREHPLRRAHAARRWRPHGPCHRHTFLEGDGCAPFVPVKRATPATAQMQSGMPQWRSSARVQPTSAGAAGMTDARRASDSGARRRSQNGGGVFSPVTARPRDGREARRRARAIPFSARSHLLHVDRVPYGHDERAEKAPNSPPARGGSRAGRARVRARTDPPGAPRAPLRRRRRRRRVCGFLRARRPERARVRPGRGGLLRARALASTPPPQLAARVALLLRGRRRGRAFETLETRSDAGGAAAARNLARTASLDARAQEEDRFRTLKARGPEYAWARRGARPRTPTLCGAARGATKARSAGEAKDGHARSARAAYAATLEAERRGARRGRRVEARRRLPPPGSSRDLSNGTRAKSDAWGLSPESVGAIQLGAGVYREYAGADALEKKDKDALDETPACFVDPRASEKAAHEKALYASTAGASDDAALEEISANRARCEAGGRGACAGALLYEARGEEETETRNAAAAREGAARARPPSPKTALRGF